MSENALQLNHVQKVYKDGETSFEVLKDININVKKGEFVAIVGPSGSGKSTVLSIAGALLCADSGDIIINNTNISKLNQKKWTNFRRNEIGFIFQNHQLIPYLTVMDQLNLILSLAKKTKKNFTYTQETALELLKDLDLESKLHQYPAKLSGGEKQRTAIARAFMNDPAIILADEPTASLDAIRGRQVVEMIKNQVKKREKAAVMVTHDERILDLVDDIYRMENGILVKD